MPFWTLSTVLAVWGVTECAKQWQSKRLNSLSSPNFSVMTWFPFLERGGGEDPPFTRHKVQRTTAGLLGTECHQDNWNKHERHMWRPEFFKGKRVWHSINHRVSLGQQKRLSCTVLRFLLLHVLAESVCIPHLARYWKLYKGNKSRRVRKGQGLRSWNKKAIFLESPRKQLLKKNPKPRKK